VFYVQGGPDGYGSFLPFSVSSATTPMASLVRVGAWRGSGFSLTSAGYGGNLAGLVMGPGAGNAVVIHLSF